ncbi:MAG TPA: FAD-linked oxidase C-terminal domain-containing protein [Polyangiales bacterium]|nr:FAD-linked oxidase C-terminal domain-containing protein [Polyangiales bacterium]
MSISDTERVLLALERSLGPSKLLHSVEGRERYMRDESEADGVVPDAVVLAETPDDIARTLAIAQEHAVPVTPRAAGTGRSGGAVPVHGGIVLATLGMNSIKDIDRREGRAVVEPGVVLGDLHAAVEAEGWFYPPDPNSLKNCAIGGNLAENSSGPRALKYGTTRDYVLGLEAVLMGGERMRFGRKTRKGVTGYDLTSLLVGSEGTLAVFCEATLKLVPKPESVITLLALFPSAQGAAASVLTLIGPSLQPRCLELLDGVTLQALRDAGNPIDARAGAMLLIEVDGPERAAHEHAQRIGDACNQAGAIEVQVAAHAAQRDRLWAARREMSYAVKKLARNKLAHDIVVPRVNVAALLEHVAEQGQRPGIRALTYGHAGDGALHVNFLWDHDDQLPEVERAVLALFQRVVELDGTLSAEHGIGVVKAPYLALEQTRSVIELQENLKRVFDPKRLLNPGKIFAAGHAGC